MKLLFCENLPEYDRYNYPYRVYARLDGDDDSDDVNGNNRAGISKKAIKEINNAYEQGFLQSRIAPNIYYLARSVRVDLQKFKPSSENRRILRKNKMIQLQIRSLRNFKYGYNIGKFAKQYFKKRFGKVLIVPSKMRKLFTQEYFTDVAVYWITADSNQQKSNIVGYCLCNQTDRLLHYVYPFYDISLIDRNLGMGMMVKAVMWAKKTDKRYVYLGSCYDKSAFYKLQFEGVEFFDGIGWSNDIELLKKSVREGGYLERSRKELKKICEHVNPYTVH